MVSNSGMESEDRLMAAHSVSPDDPRVRPAELHLDRASGLKIRWADGVEQFFALAMLRKNCPCATCRTERDKRPTGAAAVSGGGLSLTILPEGIERATQVRDAGLVGSYAISITWGDGHATGIYDFRYLRELGSESKR